MITQLFGKISEIVTAFTGVLQTLFGDVVGLIWDASANEKAGALTDFGTIVLIAMGVGLVTWGLNFILRLIRVRGGSRR